MIAVVAGDVDPTFPKVPMAAEQAQETRITMASREAKTVRRELPKVGRNESCPCGSGRKFKRCCGAPGRALQ